MQTPKKSKKKKKEYLGSNVPKHMVVKKSSAKGKNLAALKKENKLIKDRQKNGASPSVMAKTRDSVQNERVKRIKNLGLSNLFKHRK